MHHASLEALQIRYAHQKTYELLCDISFYALLESKRLLVEALERAEKAGFKPDQPRVPAGQPDGGQWVGVGGSNGHTPREHETITHREDGSEHVIYDPPIEPVYPVEEALGLLVGGGLLAGGRHAIGATDETINHLWTLGKHKSAQKWAAQMKTRAWTPKQIDQAIQKGEKFPAPNKVNPLNSASRFVHPKTGRSVVIDDITKEILQVGDDGFQY